MSYSEKQQWTLIAQIGIISRGLIFTILSFLTMLSVVQKEPSKTLDSVGALGYLEETTYGLPILILLALGIALYIFWRFFLFNTVNKNQSKWAVIRLKANHIGIALVYIFFLGIVLQLIFDLGGSGDSKNREIMDKYINEWWAKILIALVGLGVFAKGVFQFYLAYSKLFLELINEYDLTPKMKKVIIVSGRIGYISRGIVFSVLGFLVFRASYSLYLKADQTVSDAFHFISAKFGDIVLFGVAAGLFIFSLFVFLKARYRIVEVKG